jgi:hypothetical protein
MSSATATEPIDAVVSNATNPNLFILRVPLVDMIGGREAGFHPGNAAGRTSTMFA